MHGRGGNAQSTRFTFTLNNYTDAEVSDLQSVRAAGNVKYIIAGYEVGEEGTPHLQGYLETTKRFRFNGLRAELSFLKRAHVEVARMSKETNVNYCSKDCTLAHEAGVREVVREGRLAQLLSSVQQGQSEQEIMLQDPETWARNYRSIREFRRLQGGNGGRRTSLEVAIYIGPPGSGKTRKVFDDYPDLYSWPGGNWFDGYAGESVVLLDDYSGQLEFRFLLRILDIYPMQVPVKGGFVWWKPTKIFITTNRPFDTWYPDEDSEPLRRRVHEVSQFPVSP